MKYTPINFERLEKPSFNVGGPKTIWIVLENFDKCEGKGPMVPKCAATTAATAKRIANEFEPYGNSGQFNDVRELTIYETADEFIDTNRKIKALKIQISDLVKELKELEN
jgi:hypothetical protein